MNVKTYTERAYAADSLSVEQLRNESNAFHHLIGQLQYLSDVNGLNGHEKRTWGIHVIKRLQDILNDYETGKAEGKKLKGGE